MTPNESIPSSGRSLRAARTAARRIPTSLLAAALLAAPLAAGCATDAPAQEEPTGQLVFPLLQAGPDGALYQLRSATFDITSSTTGAVTTVDGSGNQAEVDVSLAPGLYSVFLRPGWQLEKSTDGGSTFLPVGALLGSFNPDTLRILANRPSITEFEFLIRDINGTLRIKLGVDPTPRELVGGIVIDTATDGLAAYAGARLDFAIYFKVASVATATLVDGTKQRIYTATPDQELGQNAPTGSAVAAEFYNDNIGTLATSVAAELTAGFLQYTVAVNPDGSFTFTGSLQGLAELDFGPSTIDAILPTLDPDGFPHDGFFYDAGAPFTLLANEGTLSGTLRVRHVVP
jgi:hypothetical protein